MTVEELRDLLSVCDPDAKVLVREHWSMEYEDCPGIETVLMVCPKPNTTVDKEKLCILVLE